MEKCNECEKKATAWFKTIPLCNLHYRNVKRKGSPGVRVRQRINDKRKPFEDYQEN